MFTEIKNYCYSDGACTICEEDSAYGDCTHCELDDNETCRFETLFICHNNVARAEAGAVEI